MALLAVHSEGLRWEIETELKVLRTHEGNSFKGKLYQLIAKADKTNLRKLVTVYPLEVVAWFAYMDSLSTLEYAGIEVHPMDFEDDFFKVEVL